MPADRMKAIEEWLQERHDNCIRISKLAGCPDPEEWREDARNFSAAIRELARLKEAEVLLSRLIEYNDGYDAEGLTAEQRKLSAQMFLGTIDLSRQFLSSKEAPHA